MSRTSDIKLSYACNNECIHCVIAGNKESLLRSGDPIHRTFEECKEEIIDARANGAREVVLTGGEPTLRKDFIDLLEIIKEQCLTAILQTNGRAFKDYRFAEQVAEYPITLFGIALHGHSAKLHDQITRKPNSFQETVQGISHLIRLNKRVQVKFVISKYNYQYIEETSELLRHIGVKSVNVTFPHAIGNAGKYFDEVVPRYSEIKDYVLRGFKSCMEKGIVMETEAIPYCFLEGYEEWVTEHYMSTFDTEIRPIGSGIVNWSKRRLEMKRKGPQCERCLYARLCEGIWEEYADHFGTDELTPIEVTPQNMMAVLTKFKRVKDARAGKLKEPEPKEHQE
jgi:MoaA/NifB/PqqE/SkfB family radical SAM enzyme